MLSPLDTPLSKIQSSRTSPNSSVERLCVKNQDDKKTVKMINYIDANLKSSLLPSINSAAKRRN